MSRSRSALVFRLVPAAVRRSLSASHSCFRIYTGLLKDVFVQPLQAFLMDLASIFNVELLGDF